MAGDASSAMKALSDDEVSAPEPLKTAALLLLDTGLPVGECLNLQKEDVHIEPAGNARYGWVHVRSSKSRNAKRNVPMTVRVSLALAPRLKDPTSPWVFPGDLPDRPLLVTSLAHAHIRVCRPGFGKTAALPVPQRVCAPLMPPYDADAGRRGWGGCVYNHEVGGTFECDGESEVCAPHT